MPLWLTQYELPCNASDPAALHTAFPANRMYAAISSYGRVHAYSLVSGKRLFAYSTNGKPVSTMDFVDDVLFVLLADGSLYLFDGTTGRPLAIVPNALQGDAAKTVFIGPSVAGTHGSLFTYTAGAKSIKEVRAPAASDISGAAPRTFKYKFGAPVDSVLQIISGSGTLLALVRSRSSVHLYAWPLAPLTASAEEGHIFAHATVSTTNPLRETTLLSYVAPVASGAKGCLCFSDGKTLYSVPSASTNSKAALTAVEYVPPFSLAAITAANPLLSDISVAGYNSAAQAFLVYSAANGYFFVSRFGVPCFLNSLESTMFIRTGRRSTLNTILRSTSFAISSKPLGDALLDGAGGEADGVSVHDSAASRVVPCEQALSSPAYGLLQVLAFTDVQANSRLADNGCTFAAAEKPAMLSLLSAQSRAEYEKQVLKASGLPFNSSSAYGRGADADAIDGRCIADAIVTSAMGNAVIVWSTVDRGAYLVVLAVSGTAHGTAKPSSAHRIAWADAIFTGITSFVLVGSMVVYTEVQPDGLFCGVASLSGAGPRTAPPAPVSAAPLPSIPEATTATTAAADAPAQPAFGQQQAAPFAFSGGKGAKMGMAKGKQPAFGLAHPGKTPGFSFSMGPSAGKGAKPLGFQQPAAAVAATPAAPAPAPVAPAPAPAPAPVAAVPSGMDSLLDDLLGDGPSPPSASQPSEQSSAHSPVQAVLVPAAAPAPPTPGSRVLVTAEITSDSYYVFRIVDASASERAATLSLVAASSSLLLYCRATFATDGLSLQLDRSCYNALALSAGTLAAAGAAYPAVRDAAYPTKVIVPTGNRALLHSGIAVCYPGHVLLIYPGRQNFGLESGAGTHVLVPLAGLRRGEAVLSASRHFLLTTHTVYSLLAATGELEEYCPSPFFPHHAVLLPAPALLAADQRAPGALPSDGEDGLFVAAAASELAYPVVVHRLVFLANALHTVLATRAGLDQLAAILAEVALLVARPVRFQAARLLPALVRLVSSYPSLRSQDARAVDAQRTRIAASYIAIVDALVARQLLAPAIRLGVCLLGDAASVLFTADQRFSMLVNMFRSLYKVEAGALDAALVFIAHLTALRTTVHLGPLDLAQEFRTIAISPEPYLQRHLRPLLEGAGVSVNLVVYFASLLEDHNCYCELVAVLLANGVPLAAVVAYLEKTRNALVRENKMAAIQQTRFLEVLDNLDAGNPGNPEVGTVNRTVRPAETKVMCINTALQYVIGVDPATGRSVKSSSGGGGGSGGAAGARGAPGGRDTLLLRVSPETIAELETAIRTPTPADLCRMVQGELQDMHGCARFGNNLFNHGVRFVSSADYASSSPLYPHYAMVSAARVLSVVHADGSSRGDAVVQAINRLVQQGLGSVHLAEVNTVVPNLPIFRLADAPADAPAADEAASAPAPAPAAAPSQAAPVVPPAPPAGAEPAAPAKPATGSIDELFDFNSFTSEPSPPTSARGTAAAAAPVVAAAPVKLTAPIPRGASRNNVAAAAPDTLPPAESSAEKLVPAKGAPAKREDSGEDSWGDMPMKRTIGRKVAIKAKDSAGTAQKSASNLKPFAFGTVQQISPKAAAPAASDAAAPAQEAAADAGKKSSPALARPAFNFGSFLSQEKAREPTPEPVRPPPPAFVPATTPAPAETLAEAPAPEPQPEAVDTPVPPKSEVPPPEFIPSVTAGSAAPESLPAAEPPAAAEAQGQPEQPNPATKPTAAPPQEPQYNPSSTSQEPPSELPQFSERQSGLSEYTTSYDQFSELSQPTTSRDQYGENAAAYPQGGYYGQAADYQSYPTSTVQAADPYYQQYNSQQYNNQPYYGANASGAQSYDSYGNANAYYAQQGDNAYAQQGNAAYNQQNNDTYNQQSSDAYNQQSNEAYHQQNYYSGTNT